jgi:plastocyanin
MRQPTLLLLILLGAALPAGCGGDDDSPAAATGAAEARNSTTIKIADFVYAPDPATVRAGARISIPNADAAPHTITDDGSDKAFDSGTIKGRATGSLTIDRPGSYSYICEFHPFMKGKITVTK